MGLREYFKINNSIDLLGYYKEKFNEKEISKSHFEDYSNYYYKIWDNLEYENNEEFEFFLKNFKLLYMEFFDMKKNKIILNKEFELIRDFILKLIEYDSKNNKSNNELNQIIIKVISILKKNVTESLLTKKQLDETIHKLLSN